MKTEHNSESQNSKREGRNGSNSENHYPPRRRSKGDQRLHAVTIFSAREFLNAPDLEISEYNNETAQPTAEKKK